MTTGEGLLAAVLDEPADDLPRLVYADWLDENRAWSDEGQFIRGQVFLAKGVVCERDGQPVAGRSRAYRPRCRCGNCATSRRTQAQYKRRDGHEDKYLRIATPAWWRAEVVPHATPGVRPAVRHLRPRCHFRWGRGFVSEVHCNDTFARHALGAVLREWPVEEVYVTANGGGRGVFVLVEKAGGRWRVAWGETAEFHPDRARMALRVAAVVRDLFPAG